MSGGTAADWFVFGGENVPPAGSKYDDWQYQRVDDYISMALRYQDNCRTVYAPFNIEALNQETCRVRRFLPWERITVVSRTYASRIRIDKRMIGGTYSKRILLGEFGKSQPYGSINKDVIVTRIYLNLAITVPENCVLNSGQIFTIDFGNIPSSSFKRAHEKAEGVNPIVRTIGIQCTNIHSQANLAMRVQADSFSGNIIISNNKDVGFVITDSDNKELTPNLLSSMIPFVLGDSSSANVTIKLYPASVTGRQPKEGAVTSLAYLRVDFS
ncbi:fimbrial protein [Serratia ureilytica]|nr:fimbrial protein [Serratia ureilytica]